MNTDLEGLSVIATAIAELTDQLAWLEIWVAKRALDCGYPGVIARHLRQSRWRVKRMNVVAERFPHLVPSNKEASQALQALTRVELYAPNRQEVPNPEIPVDIYRLAAQESEGPVGANAWVRLVGEQGLSLRQLQQLIKRQRGESSVVPYMRDVKMASRIEGDDLVLSPAEGEPFEFHGEPPSTLIVTAIEVEDAPE